MKIEDVRPGMLVVLQHGGDKQSMGDDRDIIELGIVDGDGERARIKTGTVLIALELFDPLGGKAKHGPGVLMLAPDGRQVYAFADYLREA